MHALSRVWQHVKMSDVSHGTRSRYGLAVDEDVKKPTKQTNKQLLVCEEQDGFFFILNARAFCMNIYDKWYIFLDAFNLHY